jgi:hypothetical protein
MGDEWGKGGAEAIKLRDAATWGQVQYECWSFLSLMSCEGEGLAAGWGNARAWTVWLCGLIVGLIPGPMIPHPLPISEREREPPMGLQQEETC